MKHNFNSKECKEQYNWACGRRLFTVKTNGLTNREIEIAQSYFINNRKIIAKNFNITEGTIKSHLSKVKEKWAVKLWKK